MSGLVLYHGPGSVSSQKVRVVLAEKGLEWESRLPGRGGMRTPEYLKLNPNGLVPTLLHDGAALIESRLINEYLEDRFPTPALTPAAPSERHAMRLWTREADDDLHLAVFSLMFVISRRDDFITAPRNEWRARLPGLRDPIKQRRTMDLAENGFASPFVDESLARFVRLMEDMDEALKKGPWLAGSALSLADAEILPFIQRLSALGLDIFWRGAHPRVEAWYNTMRARPSFDAAITKWETAQDLEMMASKGRAAAPLMSERLAALRAAPAR